MATELPIVNLLYLLLASLVVALMTRRLKLPYAISLVIAGLLSFFEFSNIGEFRPDVFFLIFLPPLIFEGSHQHLVNLSGNCNFKFSHNKIYL